MSQPTSEPSSQPAGLDLSGVASAVGEWIVDLVEITRAGAEQLDTSNGWVVPGPRDLIYRGLGMVTPTSTGGVDAETQRVLEESGAGYRLLVPTAAEFEADPRAGDVVTVLEVRGYTPDPHLLRRVFEVVELPVVSSLLVARIIYLRQVRIDRPSDPGEEPA